MTLATSIHIYIGWGITGVVAAAYGFTLTQRGKRAAAQVPEGKRRWSDPA